MYQCSCYVFCFLCVFQCGGFHDCYPLILGFFRASFVIESSLRLLFQQHFFFRLFLVSRAYTNWEMLQMYMVLSYIVCVVDFEQLKNATLCLKVQYSVRTG